MFIFLLRLVCSHQTNADLDWFGLFFFNKVAVSSRSDNILNVEISRSYKKEITTTKEVIINCATLAGSLSVAFKGFRKTEREKQSHFSFYHHLDSIRS